MASASAYPAPASGFRPCSRCPPARAETAIPATITANPARINAPRDVPSTSRFLKKRGPPPPPNRPGPDIYPIPRGDPGPPPREPKKHLRDPPPPPKQER